MLVRFRGSLHADRSDESFSLVKEYRDASGRLSIAISVDGSKFELYASRLEGICGAKCIQQLAGLDQKYSDSSVQL